MLVHLTKKNKKYIPNSRTVARSEMKFTRDSLTYSRNRQNSYSINIATLVHIECGAGEKKTEANGKNWPESCNEKWFYGFIFLIGQLNNNILFDGFIRLFVYIFRAICKPYLSTRTYVGH